MSDAPTIGVDVGGTKVLGVVVDADGEVVAEVRRPTPLGGGAVVDAMVEVVAALRQEDAGRAATAVGAGVPGLVDRNGVLRGAPNLPGVTDLDVQSLGEAATGLRWRVDNDATVALWGEHLLGAARGVADVALVTLGTGIGGGLIAAGSLVRGAHGFAGEIGHMVVDVDGVVCVCGRSGCWERYASGSGLGRLAREVADAGQGRAMVALAGGDPMAVRGEHVTRAAAEGDPDALALVDVFADWFAVGLANLVQILDIERCVVGGGLVTASDVLLPPIVEAFGRRLGTPRQRPTVAIVPAELGASAGAIGAALLARDTERVAGT
ncbi:MAG TPA: ROK family protein [Acidimicrobiales bacterium]|nr:ROK family protein [Acidimicrobiales bacterium]